MSDQPVGYYLLQGENPTNYFFSKDIHMYDKRVELEYHRVLTFLPPTPTYQPNGHFLFRLPPILIIFFLLSLICLVLIIIRPPHRNSFDLWYFYSNNLSDEQFFFL